MLDVLVKAHPDNYIHPDHYPYYNEVEGYRGMAINKFVKEKEVICSVKIDYLYSKPYARDSSLGQRILLKENRFNH